MNHIDRAHDEANGNHLAGEAYWHLEHKPDDAVQMTVDGLLESLNDPNCDKQAFLTGFVESVLDSIIYLSVENRHGVQ